MSDDNIPGYIDGAKFINTHDSPPEWMYPRDFSDYEVSRKFRSRFREIKGIFDGQDIRDVVEFGDLYAAAQGCASFVMAKDGVALYLVVSADLKKSITEPDEGSWEEIREKYDIDKGSFTHTAVTIWPYIVDSDTAWAAGISTKQQEIIEDIKPDLDY